MVTSKRASSWRRMIFSDTSSTFTTRRVSRTALSSSESEGIPAMMLPPPGRCGLLCCVLLCLLRCCGGCGGFTAVASPTPRESLTRAAKFDARSPTRPHRITHSLICCRFAFIGKPLLLQHLATTQERERGRESERERERWGIGTMAAPQSLIGQIDLSNSLAANLSTLQVGG